MGESAAQTVKEIEDVRDRLDGELRELEERMPAARTTQRIAAGLLTGTTGSVTFWLVKRVRARRKKSRSVPVNAVVQVVPDQVVERVSKAMEDGSWKGPASLAAGAWALFKIAEVRQLRRMNRLLASRP